MVEPVDHHKSHHQKPASTDKPAQTHHSSYKVSDAALAPFKKMMPDATNDQLQEIFNNMMKAIAAQIKSDQKFHEEQVQQRKEESGDDGEF